MQWSETLNFKTAKFLENIIFGEKPQISVMLETNYSKEIRICMQKNNIMKEHTAPAPIVIMVLSGVVKISSPNNDASFGIGECIYFDALVPHSLIALEDSVIRLTLSKIDSVKRVEGVAM